MSWPQATVIIAVCLAVICIFAPDVTIAFAEAIVKLVNRK